VLLPANNVFSGLVAKRSITYAALAGFLWSATAHTEILFEETTILSGIAHTSRSFGAAWGDFDNDGWVDLYVNNHQHKPSLFLNRRDGTFSEVYDSRMSFNAVFEASDQHGASWADYDNDGDQDLVVLVGGNGGDSTSSRNANHFYVNEGGYFYERAAALGVDLPSARGRSPLWLDVDSDGSLELAISNLVSGGTPITTIFTRQNETFHDIGPNVGFQIPTNVNGLQASDLNNNDRSELIAFSSDYGMAVYDTTYSYFTDVTSQIISSPSHARGNGVVVADFNNDFYPDVFVPLAGKPSELNHVSSQQLNFSMYVTDTVMELGFDFRSDGVLTLELAAPWHRTSDVYIGSQRIHPESFTFHLDPSNPLYHGFPQYQSQVDRGIYIGFDPSTSTWSITLNTDFVNHGALDSLLGIITSQSDIVDPVPYGFTAVPQIWPNKLLLNTGSDLIEQGRLWGVNEQIPSVSAVAGDFDNDMDLDLYVVNSLRTVNYPNRLYENIGGAFRIVPNAGNAAGNMTGIGQNVVTADYDQDGFLDLYVMNGGFEPPFSDTGEHQLFRNAGNNNHWIEIDLEGIASNRDAIGAKVFVTAGGVTQWREQNNKMHYYSQDHKRLHFGLANNVAIDEIRIIWPNGTVQRLRNIPADQIIHLYEATESPSVAGGPVYHAGSEAGIFVWQEYFDGPYHLRTIGDGNLHTFDIQLLSDSPLSAASPTRIEQGDIFTPKTNGFHFISKLTSWEDGVDFVAAPNAQLLLAFTHNGRSNPRDLYVGGGRSRIPPAGWIANLATISSAGSFFAGRSVYTTVTASSDRSTIQFRATANAHRHNWDYQVFLESPAIAFTPSFLEHGDSYTQGNHLITVNSLVQGPWIDGFDITPRPQDTSIGITYLQDGYFQATPETLKGNHDEAISPNAFLLPRLEPYGAPSAAPGSRAAMYIWKDNDDLWHLRFTAGDGPEHFIGSIQSSLPFVDLNAVRVEPSDSLSVNTDNTRADFSMKVDNVWEDSIEFRVPAEATLHIDLSRGGAGAGSIFIGENQWPIQNLPVNLSNW